MAKVVFSECLWSPGAWFIESIRVLSSNGAALATSGWTTFRTCDCNRRGNRKRETRHPKEGNRTWLSMRFLPTQCSFAAEPGCQAQLEDLKRVSVRWIALEVAVPVHTIGESWRIRHCPMLLKAPRRAMSLPLTRGR